MTRKRLTLREKVLTKYSEAHLGVLQLKSLVRRIPLVFGIIFSATESSLRLTKVSAGQKAGV